jgi:hypothetical protein
LTNVTFNANTAAAEAGGMYNKNSSNPQISNTIFWGNMPYEIYADASSSPSMSYSVVQDGYSGGTNIITTDPLLGAPGDHGGHTQTIPLLAGSSAIDTGNAATCPATDQRGMLRPWDGDGSGSSICDIGAYEVPSPSPIFGDVPASHWAISYIESLYADGVTGGCTTDPLNYCPETKVNRAQMAVFLLKGIYGATYTPPTATGTVFGDVAANYWAAAWIEQLAAEGITGGCSSGNYCPNTPVTRDQMAVFLLRAEHGNTYTPPAATGVFTDVPTGYWAAPWIEQLAAEGITGGCGVDDYCPATVVNRAQMAVFLVATFNLP